MATGEITRRGFVASAAQPKAVEHLKPQMPGKFRKTHPAAGQEPVQLTGSARELSICVHVTREKGS